MLKDICYFEYVFFLFINNLTILKYISFQNHTNVLQIKYKQATKNMNAQQSFLLIKICNSFGINCNIHFDPPN